MGDITKPFREEIRKTISGPAYAHLNVEERAIARDYIDSWDVWAEEVEKHRRRYVWHPFFVMLLFPVWIVLFFRSDRKLDKMYAELEAKQKRWNATISIASNRRKSNGSS